MNSCCDSANSSTPCMQAHTRTQRNLQVCVQKSPADGRAPETPYSDSGEVSSGKSYAKSLTS